MDGSHSLLIRSDSSLALRWGRAQILALRPIKSGTSCTGMSLGKRPRDSQETFGKACQIGHTVLRSAPTRTDALSSHQLSRKPASCRDGCRKRFMLAHGFAIQRLLELVHARLATATAERVVAGSRKLPRCGSRMGGPLSNGRLRSEQRRHRPVRI